MLSSGNLNSYPTQPLNSNNDDVILINSDIIVISHRRRLSLSHVRTLKMAEEVLCVCYSANGRLLAVALLDSTVKVFFTDSLKVETD